MHFMKKNGVGWGVGWVLNHENAEPVPYEIKRPARKG